MGRPVAFPSKFAPRGVEKPITGPLDKVTLTPDQRQLIDRITVGLFLDMQNEPLADIFSACYISGMNHGMSVMKEGSDSG